MHHSFLLHLQNSEYHAPNLQHWHLSVHFFLQPQVILYISGSVTIHLLGINTESTEFQSSFTRFKLVSGANIRFKQFKTTEFDLRTCPCHILEVGGKDLNVLFFFVIKCMTIFKAFDKVWLDDIILKLKHSGPKIHWAYFCSKWVSILVQLNHFQPMFKLWIN